MSYDSVRQIIVNKLIDNWTATVVVYDETIDPPTSGSWIRLNIMATEAYVASLGGSVKKYRHPGVIVIEIYVPIDQGAGIATRHGDSLAAIFRGVKHSTTIFQTPTVRTIGREAGLLHVNVEIPFYTDTDY